MAVAELDRAIEAGNIFINPIQEQAKAPRILGEEVLWQQGGYKRVRRWLEGFHPERGSLLPNGLSGGPETVQEVDLITPMQTYHVQPRALRPEEHNGSATEDGRLKEKLLFMIHEQPQVVAELVDQAVQKEEGTEGEDQSPSPYKLTLHKEEMFIKKGGEKGTFIVVVDYDKDFPPGYPQEIIGEIHHGAKEDFERGETSLLIPCREYELLDSSHPDSSVRFVAINAKLPEGTEKIQVEAAAQLPIVAHKLTASK